ncbi:uncharacterized protein LOC128549717 [Mercenaria mercenaria]|uniref:uncharacterized protein LOC128549717 n=1 Tax=Mercenaria mercenaria TaxID=6596 RepID=UPI00234E453E|nr:uncharacterized protein LOC128549717 [Mercenaria mercenaria]
MNTEDYKKEILRQLSDGKYYEKHKQDPKDNVLKNISTCIESIEETNSNVTKEFDVFPESVRTPVFYVLPKIHKAPDSNLPLNYPGRPNVSACSSPTENISKYLDYILKPHMINLPSYIKDTTDFIEKIKSFKFKSEATYLVTLDVSSLYTNIPHSDGIDACKYFLDEHCHGRLKSDDVAKLIKLVLQNNYFKFDENFYLQKMGTSMGSSMAPSYGSLFMGKFEQDFLRNRDIQPTLWLRFLDDIFMVWDHSLEELELFIRELNSFHPDIKFTHTISQDSLSFLDVNISKGENLCVETNIYVKETNDHQYLDYTSCHPKQCKNGIPYSQAKRYRRIISDDDKFKHSLSQLREFFLDRGYPHDVLDRAFQKVVNISQQEALQTQVGDKNSVIPFTIVYDPALPRIGNTINKYWSILNLSKSFTTKSVYENFKPVVAYRRPKNLQDYLISSEFNKQSDKLYLSQRCNGSRCSHCTKIETGSEFTSQMTGQAYSLHHNVNCKSNIFTV